MYNIILFLALFFQASLAQINCNYENLEYKIAFNLFTNANGAYRPLKIGNYEECPDQNKPVKMIIHGWKSNPNHEWIQNMNKAYYQKGSYTVMAVNWSLPAKNFLYFPSVLNTKCVGDIVGNFIVKYLNEECQIPYSQVQLIGHSLGAHLAGFAGKYVAKNSKFGRIVGRISGLDMAGPGFCNEKPQNRLFKGDADIVDVYHTDQFVGCMEPVGNYDFYINGGVAPQPGCIENIAKKFLGCSHGRAHEYYTESITSDNFIAFKCEERPLSLSGFKITGPTEIMGEGLTATKPHGLYCIETNSKPPYAILA